MKANPTEQALIGTLLVYPEECPRVLEVITIDDIKGQAERFIFQAIQALYNNGNKTPDVVQIIEELERRGWLQAIGGREYLAKLQDYALSARQIDEYVETLLRRRYRYQIIRMATDIIQAAKHGDKPQLTEAFTKLSETAQLFFADYEGTEEFIPMSHVEPETPQWVIEDWIPRNGLSIMAGHPGTGKTWAALAMAAFVASQGGRVVIISTEDAAGILRNRLDAIGVDMAQIGDNILVPSKPLNLLLVPDQEARWQEIGQRLQPDLVILDSLQSFFPGRIDINRANEVREALNILDRAFPGAGILALYHRPKSGSDPILGSVDFRAKARSVISIEQDPLTGERIMRIVKCNYKDMSLIRPISFGITPEGFRWKGASVESVAGLTTEEQRHAAEVIIEALKEAGPEGISVSDLKAKLKSEGIPEKIYRDTWEHLARVGYVPRLSRGGNPKEKKAVLLRRGEVPRGFVYHARGENGNQSPNRHSIYEGDWAIDGNPNNDADFQQEEVPETTGGEGDWFPRGEPIAQSPYPIYGDWAIERNSNGGAGSQEGVPETEGRLEGDCFCPGERPIAPIAPGEEMSSDSLEGNRPNSPGESSDRAIEKISPDNEENNQSPNRPNSPTPAELDALEAEEFPLDPSLRDDDSGRFPEELGETKEERDDYTPPPPPRGMDPAQWEYLCRLFGLEEIPDDRFPPPKNPKGKNQNHKEVKP